MLFTSFLIFLVFSTFVSYPNIEGIISPIKGHSIIINRLGTISIVFTLILLITSIDVISLTPGITLYNGWFNLTSYNLPLIIVMLLLTIVLLIYNTSINKYDLKSPYYILILIKEAKREAFGDKLYYYYRDNSIYKVPNNNTISLKKEVS